MVFYFTTKDLLRRLLSELDHQREPVRRDEVGDRLIVDLALQIGTPFIILDNKQPDINYHNVLTLGMLIENRKSGFLF